MKEPQTVQPMSISLGDALNLPSDAPCNLREVLEQAVAEKKPETGLVFVADNGAEKRIGLETLLKRATSVLAGLQEKGLGVGDHLILQLDDKYEFMQVFWACILGGIVPAPVAPTVSLDPGHKTFKKFLRIYRLLDSPLLVLDNVPGKLADVLRKTEGDTGKDAQLFTLSDLSGDYHEAVLHAAAPDDLAFLQFTSGSTGNPKGVMLTHKNLISNMYSINRGAGFSEQDRAISWMPLYHDMGLIGGHLAMILSGTRTWHMRPFTFIKRPLLWLKKIDEHRLTATVSPNFGYKWVLEKVKDKQLANIDLSCLRLIFNGAEPISVSVMNSFQERMANLCGLDKRAMFPVYGMAEASLAVSFPPVDELPRHSSVSRSSLGVGAPARFVEESARDSLLMSDEGRPVQGVSIRIMDDADELLPEAYIGNVLIQGDNVTAGYFKNPEANEETFCDGWLRTGDLGFLKNGRLTITGRAKDIIFINGQNFYAHDLEEVVAQQPGIDSNGIAVVAYRDEFSDEERVVLFMALEKGVGTKGDDLLKVAKPLILSAGQEINEVFGFYPHFISIINRRDIPKTSSGKLQRYKLLDRFNVGDFDQTTLSYLTLLAGPRSQYSETDEVKDKSKTGKVADFFGQGLPPSAKCEDMLRSFWSEYLGIPAYRIKRDHSFAELGGTSIKAIEIIGRLEDSLGCQIPPHVFAKANTIASIVEYLHEHQEEFTNNPCTPGGMRATVSSRENDIAIIGASCRLPGADSMEEFWQNLRGGVDSVTEVPKERWDVRAHYSRGGSEKNKSCSKWGGFLKNIRMFDADFFKIQPDEADHLDPQQRLFLEIAWEVMANGGYTNLKESRTGVFVGASFIGYTEEIIRGAGRITIRPSTATGNLLNMIAARVSHFFNFKGPAMAVDTACSSSLAAIHLACQSLRTGECEMALAGGISLNLSETPYIFFSEAGALSPDGVCRVFDEDANGFVPGEGGGAVLLKPYHLAREDGDHVLAIIKGSAVNNDGHSMGIMAPNPHSQADVIRQAYLNSGFSPSKVSYLEAHGTATSIGDSIEVRSLSNVFSGLDTQQCAIGSVKSNIGHLLAASGMAGLLKVLLCLQHRTLVPSLHCRQEKKFIRFEQTPFYVSKVLHPWEPAIEGGPLVAGINSFGFGGTNCHLIVQEAPFLSQDSVDNEECEAGSVLLTVSAHHPKSLQQKIAYLQDYLHQNPACSLRDVSYTLNVRKSHFKQYRLALVADSRETVLQQLDVFEPKLPFAELRRQGLYYVEGKHNVPKVVFIFSGQGAQFPEMGKVLYEREAIFRETIDLCHDLMDPYFEHDIVDLICGDHSQEELNKTDITQPLTFVMDLALAMFWQSLGLKPLAVLGHSVGEYVAAVIAGILAIEDALMMAVVRGKLMSRLPAGGGMAAVFATEEEINSVLQEGCALSIAGYNGPENIVLSGDVDELERCLEVLRLQGINSFKLQVSHAFHSKLMEPVLAKFAKNIEGITFQAPIVPFVSNLTGTFVEEGEIDHDYWLRHILEPVQFATSIKTLCDQGCREFLEVGGKDQLCVLTGKMIPEDAQVRSSLPNPRKNKDQYHHLLGVIAEMYTKGLDPEWQDHFERECANTVIPFPNYPFQRQEYWLSQDQAVYPFESLIKRRGAEVFSIVDPEKMSIMTDYKLAGRILMPVAGQCELLLSCFNRSYGYSANRLRFFVFAMPWTSEDGVDILFKEKSEGKRAQIVTGNRRRGSDETPDVFTSCIMDMQETTMPDPINIESVIARCPRVSSAETLYQEFAELDLQYGPYFQNVRKVYSNGDEAIAEISLSAATSADAVCVLHPGLLDAVLQAAGCCDDDVSLLMPMAINDIVIYRRPEVTGIFAYIRRLPSRNADLLNFDIDIVDRVGKICVAIKGFSAKIFVDQSAFNKSFLFSLNWQEQQLSSLAVVTRRGRWLLIDQGNKVGEHVQELLNEKGVEVLRPELILSSFDDSSEESYKLLFNKIVETGGLLGIIHCGESGSVYDYTESAESEGLLLSVQKLFYLFKGLSRSSLRKVSFLRVSRKGQMIHADEQIGDLAKTLSTGFLRSMAREMARVKIRSVDFSAEHSSSVMASSVVEELGVDGHLETAYRAGRRYVNSLQPWHGHEDDSLEVEIVSGHVYWVVGGMQGVGAECALHLVAKGATRLVISGRTPLPPESEYDACLEGGDGSLADKIRLMRRLQETGCEVMYLSGDVADAPSVLEQYSQIKQKWGAIHGVIHSALHLEDSFIGQKSWDSFERVLAPRVWGTILLDRVTAQEPIEFFTVFSSIAGLIGNIGQGDYAASNCFMDHFIASGRRGFGRGRSIQWGQWSLGKQVSPVVSDFMHRYNLRAIRRGEGMQAFDTILQQATATGLAFVPHNAGADEMAADILNGIREGHAKQDSPAVATPVKVKVEKENVHKSPVAASGSVSLTLTEYLIDAAAGLLEIAPEDLDPERNFLELGADSMMAIQLIRNLEEALTVELYPTLLFEYPSINELVEYLYTIVPRTTEIAKKGLAPAQQCSCRTESRATEEKLDVTVLAGSGSKCDDSLLLFVTRLAAEKLDIPQDDLGLDTNFLELGADSIMALGMIRDVENELGVELHPTLLFEYPTINEFVAYLEENIDLRGVKLQVKPVPLQESISTPDPVIDAGTMGQLSGFFEKQQSWFEEQFQQQRREIAELRRLVDAKGEDQ